MASRAGALALGATGAIHIALTPQHAGVSYVGPLFAAGGMIGLALAAVLWRGACGAWAWRLGAAVAAGMALALVLSRTVGLPGVMGLPGFREGAWGALENASLFLELSFLTLAVLGRRPALRRASAAAPPPRGGLSRRGAIGALVPVVGAGVAGRLLGGPSFGFSAAPAAAAGPGHSSRGRPAGAQGMGMGGGFRGGDVDHRANGFDPSELIRDFDWGRVRRLPSGRVLREWEIVSGDKEIEVAPGVTYAAWAFNGRIPGPTLRCREGELLRIRFVNGSSQPHTMHFHGIHRAEMDGAPGVGEEIGGGLIKPGESFTYEFDAAPFGLHLYHCHVMPLAMHIAKGLYGAVVVDPKDGRAEADELIMVMNGFDTDFDGQNDLYAVNSIGFAYERAPIKVRRGELVRIYLVNLLEYDPLNSFHIHGNFFEYFPTGTSLRPTEYTDTIAQVQGQRGVLELRFRYAGKYLFHAHKTEFAELGWLGFFEVQD